MNKFKLFSISLNNHQFSSLLHEVDCVNFQPSILSQIEMDFNEHIMPMTEIPSSVNIQWNSTKKFKIRDLNLGPLGNLTIHVILFEAILLE